MRRVLLCAVFFLMTAGAWAATGANRSTVRRSPAGQTATHATRSAEPDAVLFGDKTIESSAGRDTVGSVRAFRFVDKAGGTARSISIYVASHSRARTLLVGLYRNKGRNPGSLLVSASLSAPKSGGWNKVTIKSTAVKAGQDYWLALLSKGGTLYFRDRRRGICTSENAPAIRRTALPRSARKGRRSNACPISAYVSGQPAATATKPSTLNSATTAQTTNGRKKPAVPVNTTAPSISGAAQQGHTLTTSNGSWSGSPTSYAYQWQDCSSGCSNITGATGSTYTVQASDVGHTTRASVTATNTGGSASATSAQTSTVSPMPPTNTTAPSISGTAQQGQTLTASNGSWSGSPTSYAYQWQDCSSGCSNITGATGSTYAVQGSDVGDTIDVIVTATNAGGSGSALSTQTATVVPPAPSNSTAPAISGQAVQGQALTASNGSWSGRPTSYAYQWQDCNSTGGSCVSVSGASSSIYTLQASDVGSTMRVVVTATNAGGSAAASSAQTAVVVAPPPSPPSNTGLPQISGTAAVVQTLTTSNGTWTNSPTSYQYAWQDCDRSGINCTGISGANSSTYTVTTSDEGHTIQSVVTAGNAGGTSMSFSQVTAIVPTPPPAAPSNSTAPAISGQAVQGQTLTTSNGSWSGGPTSYAYQWQDCDSSGNNCSSISGASFSSYTLVGSDVGQTIRALVTATNAGGSGSATSTQTATVASSSQSIGMLFGDQTMESYGDNNANGLAQAFSYTAAGSGTTTDIDLYVNTGTTATKLLLGLYADAGGKPGNLLSSGSSSSVQPGAWNDVTVGATTITQGNTYWIAVLGTGGQLNYLDKSGGTGPSYVESATGLTSLPATYSPGSFYNVSPASAYVDGVVVSGGGGGSTVPGNTAAPAVSGTTTQGQVLSTTNGSWTGSPTGYTYAWQDCDSSGNSCTNISNATSSTYTLQASDVGDTIRSVVAATNAGGSASASSAQTAMIAPVPPPVNTALPQISGTTTEGQTLTTSNGSWSNSPTSYTYQWQDCDSSGGNCTNISGATSGSYTLASGDVNHTIRAVVTAANSGGSASASSQTGVVSGSGSGGPTGAGCNGGSTAAGDRCFYIDYGAAGDSASGRSESTPWKRAPGMIGFAGTYSHQAGDQFIFKGGVTWPNAVFPLAVVGSGVAGKDDYYGVDTGWYTGGSSSQPIFDAGNALTAGADANGPSCPSLCGAGQNDVMIDMYRRDYVEIDDIHLTNFRRDSTMSSVVGICAMINSSNQGNPAYDQNITINRVLMDHMYDDAASGACDAIVGGNSEAGHYAGNSIVENSTIAGDGATYMGGIGLVGNVENNVIHDLGSTLLGAVSTGTATISGNTFYDCMYPALPSDGGQANNKHADEVIIGGVTTSSTPAATYYIHDNVFAKNGQSGYSTGSGTGDECESLMIGNWNETDYVYNNVFYDLYGNGPVSPQSGSPTIAGAYYWNNSIEPGTNAAGGEQCFRFEGGSTTYNQLSIQNNLCVTTSGAVYGNTGATIKSSAIDHNVVLTPTQIQAGGTYAGDFAVPGSNPFVWQPPSGSAPTTGAGTNLTSKCSGGLAPLCSDTTYAGARTPVARPGGATAWDVGAYQLP